MSVIGILRNERAYRLSKFLTKIPTGSVDPELAPFQNHVTPYALAHIKAQLEFSQKVTVLSETEVQTSSGLKNASVCSCECSFFMGMAIPVDISLPSEGLWVKISFALKSSMTDGLWTTTGAVDSSHNKDQESALASNLCRSLE